MDVELTFVKLILFQGLESYKASRRNEEWGRGQKTNQKTGTSRWSTVRPTCISKENNVSLKTPTTSHPIDWFLATIYLKSKRRERHVFGVVGRERMVKKWSIRRTHLKVIFLAKNAMLCFVLTMNAIAMLSIIGRSSNVLNLVFYCIFSHSILILKSVYKSFIDQCPSSADFLHLTLDLLFFIWLT
jgi:hypothetical protein